jgi:type IV pilus assembly protein PilA
MMREKAFTLIELLVIVTIIGILTAIAIPQYATYRAQGFDRLAVSALRQLANAEEAHRAVSGAYATRIKDLLGFTELPDMQYMLHAYSDSPRGGPLNQWIAAVRHANGRETFCIRSGNEQILQDGMEGYESCIFSIELVADDGIDFPG